MKKISSLVSLSIGCFLILLSCSTAQLGQVQHNKSMQDDNDYYKSYLKYNRTQTVYSNFETDFAISATLLAPEFRAAFSDRYRGLFVGERPFLEESNQKLGFFVTLYNPNGSNHELDKEGVWNISANVAGTSLKPILIKKLDTKSRWQPFFEHVSMWSNEYLLVFDVPYDGPSDQLLKGSEVALTIGDARAKVNFRWN